jgi:signal transduction histidine kinase/CheY-like chemotaxis protein
MYELLRSNLQLSQIFALDLQEHLIVSLQWLIVIALGIFWIFPFVVSMISPYSYNWELWQIALNLTIISLISLFLSRIVFFAAYMLWQIAIFLTLALTLYVTSETFLLWFFILIPLITMMLIGWRTWVFIQSFTLIALFLLAQHIFSIVNLLGWFALLSVLSCIAMALIFNRLFGILDWAATHFASNQLELRTAREQRSELRQALDSLNQALVSLERANTELVVAQRTAEEAERFKTQFVRHLSHEFRTPLNLILGFTDVMVSSPESYGVDLPAPYRSDMRALHRSAQHLLELVNEVLDLARIESGKVTISRHETNMSQLIEEVSAMIRKHIESKGVEYIVEYPDELPLLYIDPIRIRQVLLNLLSNAIRFTSVGVIKLMVFSLEQTVRFEIADTGIGIADTELQRIFEPFQSKAKDNNLTYGTGLGLSISKQLIELHEGEIGVQSQIGVGSSFWFQLPVMLADVSETLLIPQIASFTKYASQIPERVVIVQHDDPYLIAFLKSSLNHYDIIHSLSWDETLRLSRNLHAIAVIAHREEVDTNLPDSTLLITFPFPSERLFTSNKAIHDVLAKPISRTEIQLVIERCEKPINRILIADDDPDIARLIRRMLYGRIAGRDILAAHNGLETLAMIKEHQPDLVFLDMIMPELDGQGVLDTLEAQSDYPEIAIVIISATHSRYEDVPIDGLLQFQMRAKSQLYELVSLIHQTLAVWV